MSPELCPISQSMASGLGRSTQGSSNVTAGGQFCGRACFKSRKHEADLELLGEALGEACSHSLDAAYAPEGQEPSPAGMLCKVSAGIVCSSRGTDFPCSYTPNSHCNRCPICVTAMATSGLLVPLHAAFQCLLFVLQHIRKLLRVQPLCKSLGRSCL